MKKVICAILCLCLLLALGGVCVSADPSTTDAATALDVAAKCSLELQYLQPGVAFAGETVKIFKVADVDARLQYTVCEPFADYPIDFSKIAQSAGYNPLTITLNSYVLADKLTPAATAVTDANGKVKFSDLSCGMYLVSSVRSLKDDKLYTFESFMISLPSINTEGGWTADTVVTVKSTVENETKGIIENTVEVLWKNEDDTAKRPDEIVVEIFKDGESQGTQTVTADTGWKYVWEHVADGSVWTVKPLTTPDRYLVDLNKIGDVFTLTYSYVAPTPVAPKTGETTPLTLYITLFAVSGAVLVLLGVMGLKKRSK